MELDLVKKEALLKLQKMYKEKGHEFSLQELHKIVESQFTGMAFGFKKAVDVRLPKFGSFDYTYAIEMGRAGRELNERKDTMTEEEFKAEVLKLKIKHKEDLARLKKERKYLTVEQLLALDNLVEVANRYDSL